MYIILLLLVKINIW